MNALQKTYRYRVEYIKRGKWVPVLQTAHEDADTFRLIANAEEYRYRILCDGADVTGRYRNQRLIAGGGA